MSSNNNKFCCYCGYDCKYNYDERDHLINLQQNKEKYIEEFKYKCTICDYYTNITYGFMNHLLSNKHISRTSQN